MVPQTAVILNNALMMQIFQQLDFTLQSADLLNRNNEKQGNYTLKVQTTTQKLNIKAVISEECILVDSLFVDLLVFHLQTKFFGYGGYQQALSYLLPLMTNKCFHKHRNEKL